MNDMRWMNDMPTITLANGLRVGNFCSPHSFTFTTGEKLPRCSEKRVERSALIVLETPHEQKSAKDIAFTTVDLYFDLSEGCWVLIHEAVDLFKKEQVDIVLVPFPVMQCLAAMYTQSELLKMPFRVIRAANRETKEIYPDRFCI